ncbi:MAG TPA: 2-phospho-L-lactate transferase CofD family protein, partial [Chloroflexota bacterium]
AWAGHNPINVELAALEIIYGSHELAIRAFQNIHAIPGSIVPISLNKTNLVAKLSDGTELLGESAIDLRHAETSFDPAVRLDYIALDAPAFPNPSALRAIEQAHAVVFAPGDLYSSVLPHLLVDGVAETIAQSPAKKVYCGNLMTKPGETDSFRASDFLREMVDYLGAPSIDVAIFNDAPLAESVLATYAREQQHPVEVDLEGCRALLPDAELKQAPLAYFPKNQRILRHHPQALAEAILASLE